MLCSFALVVSSFGFNGPDNLHWESDQLRCLIFSYFVTSQRVLTMLMMADSPTVQHYLNYHTRSMAA